MPLTGLFLVPLTQNSTSPVTSLLSHITLNFPCSPLPPYTVAYQLFASTSSLLPDAQTKIPRQYCQLVTTSHNPETTFIGTTSSTVGTTLSGPRDLNQITIPASSTEGFAQLLNNKLQPLWTHRQTLSVENGTSISLRDGQFGLRVGELKQAARVATAPAILRAVLFEVTYECESSNVGDNGSDEDEVMLRALLDRLIEGCGIKLDEMRLISRYTEPIVQRCDSSEGRSSTCSWALASLYMDTLRGTRS